MVLESAWGRGVRRLAKDVTLGRRREDEGLAQLGLGCVLVHFSSRPLGTGLLTWAISACGFASDKPRAALPVEGIASMLNPGEVHLTCGRFRLLSPRSRNLLHGLQWCRERLSLPDPGISKATIVRMMRIAKDEKSMRI
jgi:hypothetical protein